MAGLCYDTPHGEARLLLGDFPEKTSEK